MVLFSKTEELRVVTTVLEPRNWRLIGNPQTLSDVNKKKKEFWALLADKLNAKNTEVKKTGVQVNTCWTNAKNGAKARWAAIQLYKNQLKKTGGGPPPPEPKAPTELQWTIIEALKGTASFSGLDGVDTGSLEADQFGSAGTPLSAVVTGDDTESNAEGEVVEEEQKIQVKQNEVEDQPDIKSPITQTPLGGTGDVKRSDQIDQQKAFEKHVEVSTLQLKVLQKMSDVCDQVNDRVQLMVNLQQFQFVAVDQNDVEPPQSE